MVLGAVWCMGFVDMAIVYAPALFCSLSPTSARTSLGYCRHAGSLVCMCKPTFFCTFSIPSTRRVELTLQSNQQTTTMFFDIQVFGGLPIIPHEHGSPPLLFPIQVRRHGRSISPIPRLEKELSVGHLPLQVQERGRYTRPTPDAVFNGRKCRVSGINDHTAPNLP